MKLGIILGSGLGGLADALTDAERIPYAELEGFPQPSVAGHGGTLHLGTLSGLPVAVFQGRKHVYETGDARGMTVPIRWLKAQGAEALLVTNAAGSLNAEVGPGRLMAISDHINLLGVNPLTGPNDDAIGPRFLSMRDAYDPELRATLHAAARALDIDLAEGVYLATAGPTFETPAEIRAFRTLGADAVGMSTVPEVILARHAGLRTVAVSAITNLAEGMGGEELSHEQTLRNADVAARDLVRLVQRFAEDYARG
ncbi:purine-nucleoside phosphorylase [Solirubrobacter sp. CPCC 204708]|uniref:Purine nucleoside phosphorylase n=1 Tax=Solirubrobacter deserti TaxID=2282478 RepID=A0ABT4RTL6_9ACTN|nr:purine-nucleoside phosphorylase [Solirubrobacter deserti]MBE2318320.1 purine-nucleoside phosphorylase [Solirubrobacter deserti]MDA0141919.1 purine-nucleoside phosphorylase [Solirubrobacter deserti]